MKPISMLRVVGLLALLATAAACSSGTGPDDSPSVSGVWTGDFGGSSLRLTLQQSGSTVSGTLDVGIHAHPVTGTIDAGGVLAWGASPSQANCTYYSGWEMQLQEQGTEISGSMRRARGAFPCEPNSRTLVTQGTATLLKAF